MKPQQPLAVVSVLLATASSSSAAPPRYRIVDLTEIAAPLGVVQCEGRRVSNAGAIVGFEVVNLAMERAIVWDEKLDPSLLPWLPADNSALAVGLTPDGRPLGVSEKVEITYQGQLIIIKEDQKAVIWEDGQPVRLADLATGGAPITMRVAFDADSAGRIVGFGHVPGPPPYVYTFKAFLLGVGLVTDLWPMAQARSINAAGSIVGDDWDNQAYLWSAGVWTNLNNHPSLRPHSTDAFEINDAGLIVGEGQFNPGGAGEPTVWNNLIPQRLITEFIRPQGWCAGVNASGRVVGSYINLDNLQDNWHGFLWHSGQRWDLVDLIAPGGGSGWQILHPWDINDSGVIVGGGYRNGTWGHGFAMLPVCGADCTADGALTIADFGCFQTLFVQQDPYADCNGDSELTVADFGCFQTLFVTGCP